jgi:hypothetical protein
MPNTAGTTSAHRSSNTLAAQSVDYAVCA